MVWPGLNLCEISCLPEYLYTPVGFLSGLLAIIALVSLWYIFTSFNPTIIVKLSMNDDLLYSELTEFGIIASGIIITGIIISLGSTYFALNKYIWIKSEKLH